jgi:hypothetical protein
MPAEACTELGADTQPVRPGLIARLRIAHLSERAACVADERQRYESLGWVGPRYRLESYSQQRQLMTRVRELSAGTPPTRRRPAWRRTLATALVAVSGAAGLVLAACGGGGTDEEPAPRPPVDCVKTPELCK